MQNFCFHFSFKSFVFHEMKNSKSAVLSPSNKIPIIIQSLIYVKLQLIGNEYRKY